MLACLLIVFLSVITCGGGSSKKGVCIPPGTNFHCGDLAAFNNTRKVLFVRVGKQVKMLTRPGVDKVKPKGWFKYTLYVD